MNHIDFKFMIEKREGHGEDSSPLFLIKDNYCAVGVFDGMGGSGATTCVSEYGNDHTKAYVASRIIKEAVFNYLNNANCYSDINSEGIWNTAKSRLEQEKSNYPTKVSGLRSKLVRDYPTTLAIVTCNLVDDGISTIDSYWAGDSRNYLWNSDGFYQISKDDLDVDNDPLENLRNDGALSNCICADRAFQINNKRINVKGPFIIISATDGCFGYFITPMHFHEVLLTGLKLSGDVSEWENFVKAEMCKVTGDDISLSLCAIGFEDFESLKTSFSNDTIVGFDEISSLQSEIAELEISIKEKKTQLENSIQAGWNNYKISYMKYIDQALNEEESSIGLTSENEEIKDSTKDEIVSHTSDKINKESDAEAQPTENIDPDSITESKELSEISCVESLDPGTNISEEDKSTDTSIVNRNELTKDKGAEPIDTNAKEIAVEDSKTEDSSLSGTEDVEREPLKTEGFIKEKTELSAVSEIKDDKLETDNVPPTLKHDGDEKAGFSPKRIGGGHHSDSSTAFPRRVGNVSPKAGLRFGDKEKTSYISSRTTTSDSSENIYDFAQRLLNEFERFHSKEIALQLVGADFFPSLPKEIKEEIFQFLSKS